ncbi:predicted protein [Botrytis cinerea T4]|uniref:Uncharacterized protein n=1 Tax=Botryotinia fuckeliana (strain T4) TaxID=999810 RepID=G2Y143_BOTF4|nr:predicted protein [Botrytis cinerea T4]
MDYNLNLQQVVVMIFPYGIFIRIDDPSDIAFKTFSARGSVHCTAPILFMILHVLDAEVQDVCMWMVKVKGCLLY